MKIFLTVLETLIWHDSPQLFVAKDLVGGLHLCLAVNDTGERPHYLTVAISQAKLQQLKSGKIDLHSVFAHPEMGVWFQITSFEGTSAVAEPLPEQAKLPDEWLPAPGEFLPLQPLLRSEVWVLIVIGLIF